MANPWSRAAELAARTPPERNRFVDFLRALSILMVVGGHWTAAAPYRTADGEFVATHILAVSPWTHGLTWIVQVMPIFFLVGGYSNALSWRSARRAGRGYGTWLEGRLRRLVHPVLPLLGAWAVLGAAAQGMGMETATLKLGSQMALIPLWFLAVYVAVVLLTPLSHALWERFGMASFWGPCLLAAILDAVFFAGGEALAWANYLFVWSAVHQLGYAWRDGHLGPRLRLAFGLGGLGLLLLLMGPGPYPVSMVGVPGDGISNTTPPKVTLLALAALQVAILLSLERPLSRWLSRPRPWTATVLVNGLIMTVFLWHMTAAVWVIGLLHRLGDLGLTPVPGTAAWWLGRPLWLIALALGLIPLVLLSARFERTAVPAGPAPPGALQVAAALAACLGLGLIAYGGIASEEGWLGLRAGVLALPFAGALALRLRGRAPG